MASLASLYSIIMGPYNALGRRGGSAASRSQNAYAQKYRNDLLRIVQKYELDGDRISAIAERDRLDRGAQFIHWRMEYLEGVREEKGKNIRSMISSSAEELKGRRAAFSKFSTEWTTPYSIIIGNVKDARNASASRRDAAPMQFYRAMAVMTGATGLTKDKYDPNSPRFPSTFREAVKVAQKDLGTFIVWETGSDGTQLQATWAGADDLTRSSLGRNLKGLIEDYNARNQEYQAQKREFETGISQIETSLTELEKKMNAGAADPALQAEWDKIRDAERQLFEKRGKQIEAPEDADQLATEKRRLESEVINHPGYLDAVRQLQGALPEDEQKRRAFAVVISDPPFRAWAEDHGYDLERIGNAEVTWEGNRPTVGKYKIGIDAVKAYRVWTKQHELAPGDYGRLVSADTGEVVRLTLKDGGEVWGKRLKFHAADPLGTIRISTDEGELKEYSADQLASIVSITRKDDPSRAQKAAQSIAKGSTVADIRAQYTQDVKKEIAYHTTPGEGEEPLKYYKWKEGPNKDKYVTKQEWADLQKVSEPQLEAFRWRTAAGPNQYMTLTGLISKDGRIWYDREDRTGWDEVPQDQAVAVLKEMIEEASSSDEEISVERFPVGIKGAGKTNRWATGEDVVWAAKNKLNPLFKPDEVEPFKMSIAVTTEVKDVTPTTDVPDPVMEQQFVVPEDVEGEESQFTIGTTQVPRTTYVTPPAKAEGGVVGADGPEVVQVGEEGPEFVIPNTLMTPEILEHIQALAADRGIDIDTSVATEAEASPEEDEQLDLLQEGVTQKANSNYKLGLAMLDELESKTGTKPPASILEIKRIIGLTRSLTLNVSYMEETLNRAENSEKMSPEWQKHMADFNAYSGRVTQLQEELKKLTEKVDMSQLMAQAEKARTQVASQRDGGTV